MNVALWIAAGLLAAVFAVVGLGKIVRSHEDMAADERTGWVSDFSPTTVKLIGVLELLAVSST